MGYESEVKAFHVVNMYKASFGDKKVLECMLIYHITAPVSNASHITVKKLHKFTVVFKSKLFLIRA